MTTNATTALPIDSSTPPLHADARPGAPLSPKEAYRALCGTESAIHLFARDWWLDAAVGPDGWDVAIVGKHDRILAAMPYVVRRRWGMRILTQPALTPMLGPWLHDSGGKPAARLSSQKEAMRALIDQLPPFDHYSQTWHPDVGNWQPFYWKGFRQTTYYTYTLADLSDPDALWAGLDSKTRRAIAKAGGEHRLEVRDDLALEQLLELNRKTFGRQGLAPPYPDELVRRLDAACRARGCAKMLLAVGPDGVPQAGYYFVWDERSAYALISCADPAHRSSGANSLCLWATIQAVGRLERQYNFSGSMIESIEAYLRAFGGAQTPYFHVSKTRSRLLLAREGVLSLVGKE